VNPHLDDWLEQQRQRNLRSHRRLLRFLDEGYRLCVPDYINRPKTDLTSSKQEFRFHHGVPLSDLRTMVSWLLTHHPLPRRLATLIPRLWQRPGREELTVAGLLLANLDPPTLGQDPWMAFIHLLKRTEPLLAVLEVAEELVRGGHPVPDDAWILAAGRQSPAWHQYTVLFLSLRTSTSEHLRAHIVDAPMGGELYERIRQRLLVSEG